VVFEIIHVNKGYMPVAAGGWAAGGATTTEKMTPCECHHPSAKLIGGAGPLLAAPQALGHVATVSGPHCEQAVEVYALGPQPRAPAVPREYNAPVLIAAAHRKVGGAAGANDNSLLGGGPHFVGRARFRRRPNANPIDGIAARYDLVDDALGRALVVPFAVSEPGGLLCVGSGIESRALAHDGGGIL
jgi:hypothetical protein